MNTFDVAFYAGITGIIVAVIGIIITILSVLFKNELSQFGERIVKVYREPLNKESHTKLNISEKEQRFRAKQELREQRFRARQELRERRFKMRRYNK